MEKLTRPQVAFLADCAVREQGCTETYPPALKLQALGLIHRQPGHYGAMRCTITPEGREALAALASLPQTEGE